MSNYFSIGYQEKSVDALSLDVAKAVETIVNLGTCTVTT